MPEIRRKNVNGTAHVSERTAKFWLANGWELVDGAPAPVVWVFARTKDSAKKTARAAGLQPRDWRYVASADDLTDVNVDAGYPVLVAPDFIEHREHGAIHAAALAAGFTDLSSSPEDEG